MGVIRRTATSVTGGVVAVLSVGLLSVGLLVAPTATAAPVAKAATSADQSVSPAEVARWRSLDRFREPGLPLRHRFAVPRACSRVLVDIGGWAAGRGTRSVEAKLQDVTGEKRLLDEDVIKPGDADLVLAARNVAGRTLRVVATVSNPGSGDWSMAGDVRIRAWCR